MPQSEYTQLKKSQANLISSLPFYYQNARGEFRLYKKPGQQIKDNRITKNKHPKLYIETKNKDAALKELARVLNHNLGKSIAQKGLKEVRAAICSIAEEAFTPGQEKILDCMPDTMALLLERFSGDAGALKFLTQLSGNSSLIIEHTVNVVALTMQFCFFHDFDEKRTRHLFLCPLSKKKSNRVNLTGLCSKTLQTALFDNSNSR